MSLCAASSAHAETVTAEGDLPPGEIITVIGARTPRSRLDTTVPVDVITTDTISEASQTEINQILNVVVPSFNAAHQDADGNDQIDPADLRGLGPDHVLVLVNGKRLHQASLLNLYAGGTTATDLNAIPTSAIARIEVLRDGAAAQYGSDAIAGVINSDGAAAQYGSDAIAGVINIVLKDDVDASNVFAQTGITAAGDGEQLKLGGNTGFRLGDRGFVHLSGEFLARAHFNRSGPWTADIFDGPPGKAATDAELARRGLTRDDFSMTVGDTGVAMGSLFANTAYKLGDTFELYADGGYTLRKDYGFGFFRFPNAGFEDRIDLTLYPNGFLPQFKPLLDEWTGSAGVRAHHGPWTGDLSVTYGGDRIQFLIDHSLNASLGAASPTHFNAGALHFHQTSLNLDVTRRIDQPVLTSLTAVAGGEIRRETYGIAAGVRSSYAQGPVLDAAGNPKAAGSQVFPGFRPDNALDEARVSEAAYAGLESQPTARTRLDLGGRFEHYSDFGNTLTGKLAGRVAIVQDKDLELAVRGSASTGFRAPGLQQLWYSSITTQFVNDPATGALTANDVLISPNRSAVTTAFGAPHLKQETSVNLSGGITARVGDNVSLSADYYRVTIDDRIVLSGLLSTGDAVLGPAIQAIVAPFPNVSAAQFFVNAVDTTTNGVDVVADYHTKLALGTLKATAAGNFTKTTVDNVHVPDSLLARFANVAGSQAQITALFLGRYNRNRIEDITPHTKGTLGARWDVGRWGFGARANYFGASVYRSDAGPALDEHFGAKVIFDVDISARLAGLALSIGANNVLDTFPDELKHAENRYNDSFKYSPAAAFAGAPYGTAGGFYYVRADYTF